VGKNSYAAELFAAEHGDVDRNRYPAVGPFLRCGRTCRAEHQQAVDLMVQGLTVPSTSAWNEGADMLAAAPLRSKSLPRDPKLTQAVRTAEARVHELAQRARAADDTR
jgi:hypothetical protein